VVDFESSAGLGVFLCVVHISSAILQFLMLLVVVQFLISAWSDDLESDMMSTVSIPCEMYLFMFEFTYV
jgi:hypothetical protein